VWNGKDLLRISRVLQVLHLEDEHKSIDTSGSAVVFAAMIRSVLHDGPGPRQPRCWPCWCSSCSSCGRCPSAGAAIATLLVGVIWMMGVAGLFGVKITFLNFIALPIHLRNRRRIWPQRGRALPAGSRHDPRGDLDGHGSGGLLVDHHRGLRLAARRAQPGAAGLWRHGHLGELACITAAILALPAMQLWLHQRREQRMKKAPADLAL